jgi:hypothetical protein
MPHRACVVFQAEIVGILVRAPRDRGVGARFSEVTALTFKAQFWHALRVVLALVCIFSTAYVAITPDPDDDVLADSADSAALVTPDNTDDGPADFQQTHFEFQTQFDSTVSITLPGGDSTEVIPPHWSTLYTVELISLIHSFRC